MKLVYDVIEDAYDDTTKIRTMTEQAETPDGNWLIRTTVYTPHHLNVDVTQVQYVEHALRHHPDHFLHPSMTCRPSRNGASWASA